MMEAQKCPELTRRFLVSFFRPRGVLEVTFQAFVVTLGCFLNTMEALGVTVGVLGHLGVHFDVLGFHLGGLLGSLGTP